MGRPNRSIHYYRRFVVLGVFSLVLLSSSSFGVGLYDVFELQVTNSKTYSNPFDFNVIELKAAFTSPAGNTTSFFGFYDGNGRGGQTGNVWKLRFMPDQIGTWRYSYAWTDGTPGRSGNFTVTDTGLPGPLRVATDNSWYFMNARGQPFHARGYGMHHYTNWTATGELEKEVANLKNVLQTKVVNHGYNLVMWPEMTNRLREAKDPDAIAPHPSDSLWLNVTDTKRFNLTKWAAYDEALRFSQQNRVYAFTFAGFMYQGSQYSLTDFRVFLRYFVARFGAYYNFMGWSSTWEWMDIWSPDQVNQIMQYVYDIDPWKRLLTAHDNSHSTFAGWLGFSMRQAPARDIFKANSRRAGQQQISDPNGSGGIGNPFINKPIIGAEDIWESTIADRWPVWTVPRNRAEVRRAAWGIQMAGVMPLYDEWNVWAPAPGGKRQGGTGGPPYV